MRVSLVDRFGQGSFVGPTELQPATDEIRVYAKGFGPVNDAPRLAVQGQHTVTCAVAQLLDWCRQCAFNRPTQFADAMANDVMRQSDDLRPFRDAASLIVPGQQMVPTIIAHLVCLRFPRAVFWAVAEIIVIALKRQPRRWSRPHILEEVRKRFAPAVADEDATVAIVAVPGIVRVVATLQHVFPSPILRTLVHPVFRLTGNQFIAVQTSATSTGAGREAFGSDLTFDAAIAAAEEESDVRAGRRLSYHDPASEPLTSDDGILRGHRREPPVVSRVGVFQHRRPPHFTIPNHLPEAA